MSKYYSYNDFMSEVVDTADALARRRDNCGLEDIYRVSNKTFRAIHKLLSLDWRVFAAVTALFLLSELGLAAAITAFLVSPLGIPVAILFGAYAVSTIRQMYRDKVLPNAVKAVGEKYKRPWEAADGNPNTVDRLQGDAAEELYRLARTEY